MFIVITIPEYAKGDIKIANIPYISYPNHSPPVINIPGIAIFKYEIQSFNESFEKYIIEPSGKSNISKIYV